MEQQHRGKVAVVTGGAGFIGSAVCRVLGHEGASVVIADIDERKLSAVSGELERESVGVLPLLVDLSEASQVQRTISETYLRFGRADYLVNVAAVAPVKPLLSITEDEWEAVFRLNVTSIFLLIREFAQAAIANHIPGRVVNITSAASRIARPEVSHYAASKAAVDSLTRSAAIELAPYGLHVHAVSPGLTENEYNERVRRERPAEHAAKMNRIPFGRMGRPEEAAAVVAFLLGSGADYMTGCIIDSDGGYVLGIPAYGEPDARK